MNKSNLILVSLLLLAACNGNPAPISTGGVGGHQENTDTSSCKGTATTNNIFATWKRTFVSTTDTITIKYQIFPGNLTRITQTCSYINGPTFDASIDVASSVLNPNTAGIHYAIGETKQSMTTTTFNNKTYTCTVATTAINYVPVVFAGNCMGLVADSITTFYVLVP
jgi:hypothetical protein